MNCKNCGFDNKEEAKFCHQCGKELQKIQAINLKKHNKINVFAVLVPIMLVVIFGVVIIFLGSGKTNLLDSCYLYMAQQYLDNNSLDKAMKLYDKISTKTKTEDFYNDLCYAYGESFYNDEDFESSLKWLNKIDRKYGEYDNVKTLIKASKYGYISNNKNNDDLKTFEYLTDLKSENYKNTKFIYEDLYSWQVEINANNSEHDSETDLSTANCDDNIYFHIRLLGGLPDDYTGLEYTVFFSDGEQYSGYWDATMSDGDVKCVRVKTDSTGVLTLNIYDYYNNLIGQKSIDVTY